MGSLPLLVCCLALGIIFRRTKLLPGKAYLTLNSVVIYAALPALILEKIPLIYFGSSALMPVLMPWLIFLVAIGFFAVSGPFFGWSRQTIGCLIITCGFGNTSFVGIPVMQMLYGEEGVQIAILADQPGSFAALAILGILVASYFSTGKSTARELIKRVFSFPPFLAFLLALFLNFNGWQMPEISQLTLHQLGNMVVPLALISVGMQLNHSVPGKEWWVLAWGLSFKLLIAPAIIFILYILLMQNHSLLSQGSVMEAAMGPMITAAIIATNFGLKPELVGRIVGFGIPFSFLTLPLWYFLLELATR